jgi:cellulase/cellobiase CelA1
VTTSAGSSGGGTCEVTYAPDVWTGGFTANITLANTGTAAWTAWTATLTFPGGDKITSAWNATATQSGNILTATNLSYNGAVAAGASTSFGIQGTWSTSSASPTAYTVNGKACTTG